MHWAPPGTGDPGNAPASKIRCASAAVNLPSLVAPNFTLTTVPEVGPVASNTSVRLMVIFTGLPVFLASNAANGSM